MRRRMAHATPQLTQDKAAHSTDEKKVSLVAASSDEPQEATGPKARGRAPTKKMATSDEAKEPELTGNSGPVNTALEAESDDASDFIKKTSETPSHSPHSTAQRRSPTKKVRFCDNVEVFFICFGEEDRRGPWMQMALDRGRFLERCQEVEKSISYCLQPQHRSLMQETAENSEPSSSQSGSSNNDYDRLKSEGSSDLSDSTEVPLGMAPSEKQQEVEPTASCVPVNMEKEESYTNRP
ncbi:uncharacterized protein LOC118288210 isoform X2 [Scophthalmus maximus]|nr:uncharacterized protein LOC118288210 isoform X2 [Scophthalmus maximus]